MRSVFIGYTFKRLTVGSSERPFGVCNLWSRLNVSDIVFVSINVFVSLKQRCLVYAVAMASLISKFLDRSLSDPMW